MSHSMSRLDYSVHVQYIGLTLADPAEVRSIKVFQKDEQHAVAQAVLEKSLNCAVCCCCNVFCNH